MAFNKAIKYLSKIDFNTCDPLDKKAFELLQNGDEYERSSQALRRRFIRGAVDVNGIDRNGRKTKIKREKIGGKYIYYILGSDNTWSTPDERIWVVSMYALWQKNKL